MGFSPCALLLQKDVPQGLKPNHFLSFTARLKSCPDTKHEFFRSLLRSTAIFLDILLRSKGLEKILLIDPHIHQ
jgi:hypothetical protein